MSPNLMNKVIQDSSNLAIRNLGISAKHLTSVIDVLKGEADLSVIDEFGKIDAGDLLDEFAAIRMVLNQAEFEIKRLHGRDIPRKVLSRPAQVFDRVGFINKKA